MPRIGAPRASTYHPYQPRQLPANRRPATPPPPRAATLGQKIWNVVKVILALLLAVGLCILNPGIFSAGFAFGFFGTIWTDKIDKSFQAISNLWNKRWEAKAAIVTVGVVACVLIPLPYTLGFASFGYAAYLGNRVSHWALPPRQEPTPQRR